MTLLPLISYGYFVIFLTNDKYIYRSLGILQNSRMISMEEASYRLSEIKLGIDLGLH
jgi:protein-arginine kinase